MDTEKVYTRRRKLKLCKDGYMYVFDKKSKKEENVSFWRCHLRDTCNARAHAVNENIRYRLAIADEVTRRRNDPLAK